jgi:ADP-heptose:LPS heptosyltransferase
MMKRVLHFFFELVFARWMMPSAAAASTRHFLISGYTGLGHFVLKTAFIKKLEELYPGCKITIVAGNTFGTEFVLKGYPTLILKQESGGLKKLIFFLRVRRMKIDTAFFFFDSSPAFFIRGSIVAGIPNRIGHVFNHIPIPKYYYTKQVPVRMTGVRSEIDMNLDLLEAFYAGSFKRELRPVVERGSVEDVLRKYGLYASRWDHRTGCPRRSAGLSHTSER